MHPREVALEKVARIYRERLDFHIKHPEPSSPEAYLRAREQELGRTISGKIRIYLDTKFWVLMRDYRLRKNPAPNIGALHDWLIQNVHNGKVICPVSPYGVGEVQLQDDETTRLATAELMDELSTSVILHKEETRIPLEVRAFLENSLGLIGGSFDLLQRVWTRPLWMTYPFDAGGEDSPPEHRLAARKAAIDAARNCTIRDLVAQAYGALPMRAFSEALAPFLNEEKPTPLEKIRTFDQVFLGQLVNPLEEYADFIEGALDQLANDTSGVTLSSALRQDGHSQMTVASTIYTAFREKRVGKHLPFLRILPSILAMYVIDRDRRYKPNDFYDFFHAAAALPYCHIYLTEKSMAHLLTSKPLDFSALYDVSILSNASQAIQRLDELIDTRKTLSDPL